MGGPSAARARRPADAGPDRCRGTLAGERPISQRHSVRARGGRDDGGSDTGPRQSHAGLRSTEIRGMSFQLDSRLEADAAFVCDWPLCRVLLMNDARYPWLVLV